eukprot:3603278-Amphidinium_carterae.1
MESLFALRLRLVQRSGHAGLWKTLTVEFNPDTDGAKMPPFWEIGVGQVVVNGQRRHLKCERRTCPAV